MAITKEELTPEQIEKLKKLYRKYMWTLVGVGLAYMGFSFLANLFIVILDALYVNSKQFVFFGVFGTSIVVFSGIRGTISEKRDILLAEVKKIVGYL